jgi:two-component system, chemotaxis family, CheB/CheR fusion protein
LLKKAGKPIEDSAAAPSERARPSRADGVIPYVVGVGASAGGLEAFEQFFSHLPPDTGLAFVLVPHLEPTHKGMMPELLARHTKMPVIQVEDEMQVRPNCVYVIPPNADLSILHGKLQVLERVMPRGRRLPIDFFFRHLAADQKEKAIGIILSGMGSDGTLGLKAIKENHGMVMVQDAASAKYDSMPRCAINTGMADYIAAAQELPAKLIQYVTHSPAVPHDPAAAEAEPTAVLEKVFVLLRAHSGNDFSCYKKNTIHRRIERRMSVHQFDSLPPYVRFLQENPQEVELLYKELLIGVTNFFRDPGLFDFLKEKAIPQLLQARSAGNPVRVWNPGCSTGEEAYSLAILLKECWEALKLQGGPAIQIFATDLDKDAIDKARRGMFPAGIVTDVSPERLASFFVHEDDGYRIKKEVRDLLVFAPQNLLVDSPFTKVDILCCRNLFIYLNVETQRKLLPVMHYALNPGGLLILGTAESIGGSDRLFSPLDKKWKVFQRREVSERPPLAMPSPALPRERVGTAEPKKPGEPDMDITYAAQRALLDSYGPPSVVVNSEGDILYVNGRTGKYLEPSSGKVNNNVFAMAREGLREEIGTALQNAATRKTTVTANGVRVKSNGGFTTINLTVRPLAEPAARRGMLLVVFEETTVGQAEKAAENEPKPSEPAAAATELEDELRHARERLQASAEEMEATQEELRSANEELQSNNEELQSTNEELNSSKEELQSLNEEMQTVNAELQSKIEELSQSNSDMKNLLNGIELATVFLDNDLGVKRFTPQATRIVNLATGDIGRPLAHFTTNLKCDRLVQDAREVLDTLVPKESQVQTSDDRWYNLRVLPYRSVDNVIAGVVMTFADITPIKQLEQALHEQKAELQMARDYAQSIIATIREPLVVLSGELRIVSASAAFYETFQVTPAMTEGRLLYEIGQRQWDIPALRQLLEDILPKSSELQSYRVEHDFPTIGHKVLLLNARQIVPGAEPARLILLAMEDITASLAALRQTEL